MRKRSRQPFYLAKDYYDKVVKTGKDRLDTWPAKPLFRAYQFPSLGWRTSEWSWLAEDVLESISGVEYKLIATLHADPRVTRLRTQQALNYEDTKRIAEKLGYDHPAVNEGDIIMSTDVVVVVKTSAAETFRAISVKREEDIDERTAEKLAIECEYWRERDVPFSVALDTTISPVVVANVELVWGFWPTGKVPCDQAKIDLIVKVLTPDIEARIKPYSSVCRDCDRMLGLEEGTALAVAHHAIARRLWPVDFSRPIQPHLPLPFIS